MKCDGNLDISGNRANMTDIKFCLDEAWPVYRVDEFFCCCFNLFSVKETGVLIMSKKYKKEKFIKYTS